MTTLSVSVKSNPLYVQLDSTDIRDLETMLGMLEQVYNGKIPAAQRILKKLDSPISKNRIVKTGLCSARSIAFQKSFVLKCLSSISVETRQY